MAVDLKQLAALAAKHFGAAHDVVTRAPGRVNLIGEHTDYNDGFVLPSTVNFDVGVVAGARADRMLKLFSADYGQTGEVSLDDLDPAKCAHWIKYIAGVADQLIKAGHTLGGANIAITGDVPRGSGLSSSAALEMATITAFCELEDLDIDSIERVKLAQKAENEFVGVPCGIMDQFISGMGNSKAALFLDCRSYEFELVPMELAGAKVVICDTQKKRTLAASAYAERCRECAEGVERLSSLLGRGLKALRDVSVEEFMKVEDLLEDPVRMRCRHVVTEDARVLAAVEALRSGDLEEMGRLMNGSHASLRDDYQVSCEELDNICEIGAATEGELGSRMTGAGFGGCSVHLVKDEAVEAFTQNVTDQYYTPKGLKPTVYVCSPSDGAGRVDV